MSIVVLSGVITKGELNKVQEDYGEYVKVVVDIEKSILAAGGQWHADAEKILLEMGSQQCNLWGGGVDLKTGGIDYISLINTRPTLNDSQEVSDAKTRDKMLSIIRKVFRDYVKEK